MTVLGFAAYGDALKAIETHVPSMIKNRLASRMMIEHDASLWGPEAEAEASIRLGWTTPFQDAADVLEEAETFREELLAQGLTNIILAGMGGSSLAPELIAADAGNNFLTIMDSTDPVSVNRILDTDLTTTVMVVASKSGSTVETDSQRRAFLTACQRAGLHGPDHVVVITDPGSPMAEMAATEGYRKVFYGNPEIGGRFSALTAFGIVPTVLAGVDVRSVLEDAAAIADMMAEDDEDNMALQLAAAIAGTAPLRDKLIFVQHSTPEQPVLPGFGAWAEQLIAESTGKNGKGLLPVPVTPGSFEATHPLADCLNIHLVAQDSEFQLADDANALLLYGPLGAQFLLWEVATSLACVLLEVNPFDQPDVETNKSATRALLDQKPQLPEPKHVQGAIEVLPSGPFDTAEDLTSALKQLMVAVKSDGYLAIQAYLDRDIDQELELIRDLFAARIGRPVTFGWGPRFLHSTGQYHKGGPANGVFLQIVSATEPAELIDGRPFSFGELIQAQADGDAGVLAKLRLPVLRIRFLERSAGIQQLRQLVASLNTV